MSMVNKDYHSVGLLLSRCACACVCVCVSAALVSAAKAMCCIQCSLDTAAKDTIVCMSVCVSARYIAKSYEQIFDEFLQG